MRNSKGQFKTKISVAQLLVTTITASLFFYGFGLYMDNAKLKAEVNYLKGYSKSIEMQGLSHWDKMYEYSMNRYNKPQDVEEIIRFVFQDKAEQALKVAKCESGLKPTVENKTSSATGTFQVLSITHGIGKKYLKDPFINTLVAKMLYDVSGWTPWRASIACHGLY